MIKAKNFIKRHFFRRRADNEPTKAEIMEHIRRRIADDVRSPQDRRQRDSAPAG